MKTKLMKKNTFNLVKNTFVALLLILLNNNITISQTLFIENFNFSVRDNLELVGGWFNSGSNTPNNVKVVTPGLTYPGYLGSGVGNSSPFQI